MNVVPVKIYNDGLGIYFFVILHWALSANNWNSGNANEFNVNSNGNLNNNNVNNSDGVRPVDNNVNNSDGVRPVEFPTKMIYKVNLLSVLVDLIV